MIYVVLFVGGVCCLLIFGLLCVCLVSCLVYFKDVCLMLWLFCVGLLCFVELKCGSIDLVICVGLFCCGVGMFWLIDMGIVLWYVDWLLWLIVYCRVWCICLWRLGCVLDSCGYVYWGGWFVCLVWVDWLLVCRIIGCCLCLMWCYWEFGFELWFWI